MMSSEVRRASQVEPGAPPSQRTFRPDAILFALVLFSWVAVWRIQDLFGILGKVKFPILIQLIVLGLFFSDQSQERKFKWIQLSPILKIVLVLLAIMVIGLPFSLGPGKGFTFITRDFFPTIILMTVLASSLRESSDLDWFAFAHLLGAMVYASLIFLNFDIGPDGRLGGLVYYDANDFALLLVCTMPFAVYFLRPGVPAIKRLVALVAVGLFLVMIIRSGSRGGFLGFIGIMSYILVRYSAIPKRLRIGAVVGGFGVLVLAGSSTYWEMMGTLLNPKDDYNVTGDTGRSAVWKRGLGYMMTHPVLGTGIRTFPEAEGKLSLIAKKYAETGKGLKWSVAHNSFVEIGAECGLIALGLFTSLFLVSIAKLNLVGKPPRGSPGKRRPETRVQTKDDAAFSQMLIASFIGYMICGFFVSAEYFSYLYVLLGLVIAQQAIFRRRLLVAPTPPSSRTSMPRSPLRAPRPLRRPNRTHWLPAGS